MSPAEKKIYKKVSNPKLWEGSARFKGADIANSRVLWFDTDENTFFVNTFTIDKDGTVEFSPMPEESYN